jgi:hypothetical protein
MADLRKALAERKRASLLPLVVPGRSQLEAGALARSTIERSSKALGADIHCPFGRSDTVRRDACL